MRDFVRIPGHRNRLLLRLRRRLGQGNYSTYLHRASGQDFGEQHKRRIERRLDKRNICGCERPMLTASNIDYEIATRTRAVAVGGLGAMQLVVRKLGLACSYTKRIEPPPYRRNPFPDIGILFSGCP